MYYVYILYYKQLGIYYNGQTENLLERLQRHNARLVEYTSKGCPWELVWFTLKSSRKDAMILERKLKHLNPTRTLSFIQKYSGGTQGLEEFQGS